MKLVLSSYLRTCYSLSKVLIHFRHLFKANYMAFYIILLSYGMIALQVGLYVAQKFLEDPTASKKDVTNWAFVIVTVALWPITVPFMINAKILRPLQYRLSQKGLNGLRLVRQKEATPSPRRVAQKAPLPKTP